MNRDIHNIYDLLLKIIILSYSTEFLKYIGEDRQITEILKTEISTLNGKTRFLDFLCRLEDDTLGHIEFQFPVPYYDDLERFFDYNIVAQIRYGRITDTIVFCFGKSIQGHDKIKIGNSKDFHPRTFYLGDIDFENELEKIIQKVNPKNLENYKNNDPTNTKLTYKEELHLLLMSLSPRYKDKKVLLGPITELLKKEEIFHEEKLDLIKSIIDIEIENFLNEKDIEEIFGGIDMNKDTESIIMQAVEEVKRKHQQEAFDDGEKSGRQKERKIIAKKLKDILSNEEISRITGLSINTILLL